VRTPPPLSETTDGTFDAGAFPEVEGGPEETFTSCGLGVNGKESYVPGGAVKGCATSGVVDGEGCGAASAACGRVCGTTGWGAAPPAAVGAGRAPEVSAPLRSRKTEAPEARMRTTAPAVTGQD
jgi:hypothetical protein